MVNNQLLTTALILTLALTVGCEQRNSDALLVQAKAAQGSAAPGNSEPADFLVIVTNHLSGVPITDLDQSNFAIVNHFSIPGQACGFSNNITLFSNVGTGAYAIQVRLVEPGCTWVRGDNLAQVIVTAGSRRGQAVATLSIK
jgi:hypothetical protein